MSNYTITGDAALKAAIGRMRDATLNEMYTRMQQFGTQTSNKMKSRAPWTDRTGNARRSIHMEPSRKGANMRVSIGIGVFYGKYLELSNGGRFRIVRPTVDANRQNFLNSLKDGLRA